MSILILASRANAAANRYRETVEESGDAIRAANALAKAVDELTTAIADQES